jgi:hypothetical protein
MSETFNQDFLIKNGLVVETTATILSQESSTSTTTGALIIGGGIGVGGSVNIGGTTDIAGTLTVQGVDLLAYDPDAIYVSESTGNDVTGDGRRVQSAFATIKHALSVATTGTKVIIDAGTYTEEFPLTVPVGVSIQGAGLRATTIQPTELTNTQTCFLLNGETMVTDLTITGFKTPGYGFKFANNAKITTRSPYIERVTVLTRGSIITPTDPYGFDAADAGGGAYLDASVLDRNSLEPAMLWNECTFIVPNATGWYMTNGARAELLNAFTYFADKAIHTVSTPVGYGGDGKTKLRLDGITGVFTPGDTIYYKDSNGNTLASGVIESTSTGGYVYIDGAAWGFEEISLRAGKPVYPYGGAVQSTTQKKFGISSYSGNGTTTYLEVPSNSDFAFGTSTFALEAFVFRSSTSTTQTLFDFRTADSSIAPAIIFTGTDLLYQVGSTATITGSNAVATTGTWYHIAVARSGSSTKLFVDGSQVGSTYTDNWNYVQGTAKIGANFSNVDNFNGYIDEIRISNGAARYTTTFTPTTVPFVSDDETVLLLHCDSGNLSSTFIDDALGSQNVYSTGSAFTGTAARIVLADYHQFGAELRCIGSAAVFGNSGVIADGTGTNLKLIAFNLSHIGSGKDLSNDISLVVQPNEIIQVNNGKIYYQTVDQNGDFRVGDNFLINQKTGSVSFGEATVNIANVPNLTVTDGINSTVINPTNLQVGNLNLQGNTISSLSGNITLSPANSVVVVNGDLTIGGTLTATQFVGNLDGIATTATNIRFGKLGEIPYQTAPGLTAFIGTGTNGNLLVMGANTASFVSSTTVQVGFAANLLGGLTGQVVYQTAPNTTGFITTTSLYVGRALVADSSAGTSDKANNLNGGTAGQVPYQSAPDTTAFFGPGTAGQILVSGGAASPVYTNTSSIYVKDADIATNLRSGAAGQIPYQTGADSTNFVPAGSDGDVLVSRGVAAPAFTGTTTLYVGRAVIADSATGGAGSSNTVNTVQRTTNATHYVTFVDSNNAGSTAEFVYTTSSFSINPATGDVNATNLLPVSDNTGVVGDSSLTWSNGQFTNFTVDSTLDVRGAIDLADSDILRFGTSDDVQMFYNGSTNIMNIELEAAATELHVTDNGTAKFVIEKSGITKIQSLSTVHNTGSGALRVFGGAAVGGNMFVAGVVTATQFVGAFSGTSSIANNLANGAAGSIPYQSAPSTTAFLGIGANNSILVSNGSLPSWTINPTIGGNLTVVGNLTVQGSTTIVDSTVTNVVDPIITIGGRAGGLPPISDDGKDRGVAFQWHTGSAARLGFFGFDRNTGYFTFLTSATIVNEVVAPAGGTTRGAIDANLAGGSAGQFVYQTAANTTDFISTGSMYVNRAVIADSAGSTTGNAASADSVKTVARTTNAAHYLTFVDTNNASLTNETVYTTSSFTINPSNGYVGIGVTSPSVELHVRSTSGEMLRLDTSLTTTGGIDTGPQMSFEGHDGSVARTWALLVGAKENSTVGNYAGYFAVYSRPNGGAPAERIRVNSFGRVGVNTSNPVAQFDVDGGGRFTGITTVTNATSVHNATSGALQVGGGLGVAGGGFFGGTVTATNFVGTVSGSSAQVSTIRRTNNAVHYVTFVDSNNSTLTAEDVYTTSTVAVNPGTPSAVSTTTGALQIVNGGIGVGDSVYVKNRVGFVNNSNVSAVYQVYNAATNSLDTVFA